MSPGSNHRASPSCCSAGCSHHNLMPLRNVEGIKMPAGTKKKSLQARCVMCNRSTSWCCAECTDGPDALVPICPETSKSRTKPGIINRSACLKLHRALERARVLRRWRLIVRVLLLLRGWHARAIERAYAPGGGGYAEVAADFAERAAKVQRTA